MAEDVYCTLLMSDSYLPGAAVLAHSLRDGRTSKKLAILITVDSLLATTITELKQLYDYLIPVDRIANPSLENLYRLDRLDLRFAFTKIALWRQEQFRKIVYIDCDVVALRAPDELFDIPARFAAAPDIGWPDIFNTGVMLLTPSMSEYWSLHTLASSGTSFDGADQGLLNEYCANRPWHRLSFTYNCTPSSSYQYEPAYRHFRSSINMVHFIGKDKPWTNGREALGSGASGVYKELLGRWWSVYDLHYRLPQTSALGSIGPRAQTVQQYVKGEDSQAAFAWATAGHQPHAVSTASSQPPTVTREPPETSTVATEPLMTEPGEDAENIDRGLVEPVPTAQQRRFSAPQMDWDATKSEPPVQSKPEASNFPAQRYEMSHDPGLFQAPAKYPEPPPEAVYGIAKTQPAVYERPKPIFPWEQTAKPPTRVFADDLPEPQPQPLPSTLQESRSAIPGAGSPSRVAVAGSPATPTIKVVPTDLWDTFSRKNAWDDDSSIDGYIRALKQAQERRGQLQVLHQASPEVGDTSITSPTGITSPPAIAGRRESLILTDFPTEIERPSLPVTPAPIHRSSFWGDERDDSGNLPVAEGVPEQADWNPMERLEELRRASIVAAGELPLLQQKTLPTRDMPTSSWPAGSSPPISPTAVPPGDSSAGYTSSIASRIDANVSSNATQGAQDVQLRMPNFGGASSTFTTQSSRSRTEETTTFDEYSTSTTQSSRSRTEDTSTFDEYSIA